MKTKLNLCLTIALLTFTIVTKAQNPVTTLHHNGTTTVFDGINSFVEAYNASLNKDTLYLSAGYFNAPSYFAKGITVIGSGHFPDSAGIVTKRTKILTGIKIYQGADSLHLEGLYINGDINYDANNAINYVTISRCRLGNVLFNSTATTSSKNYCSFQECFIEGGLDFSNYGTNLLIKHCIILGNYGSFCITNIIGNALIEGNIFIYEDTWSILNISSSLIQNNIFTSSHFNPNGSSVSNTFVNNLFTLSNSSIPWGNNSVGTNYTGVPLSSIFVNQSGGSIDYSQNYHLQTPTAYPGTDGTQIGLYGGVIPFKDGGSPSNPQIIKKDIAKTTDTQGNLNIKVTVKAQNN